MRYWYIDFESYQIEGRFYVKEIAILSHDLQQCYVYYTKSPKNMAIRKDSCIRYQRRQHDISWNYGFDTFKNIMIDIVKK